MSISRVRSSRVFTISFPENLAKQVEDVAREEDRNISELFREAFRSYKADRIERQLAVARSSAPSGTSGRFTKDDVEAFVDEFRSKKRLAKAK